MHFYYKITAEALLATEVMNAVPLPTACPQGRCYDMEFPAISSPHKPHPSPPHPYLPSSKP